MSVKPVKVGRNDPCPCGSGKKYKKCHGDSTNPLNQTARANVTPAAPFSIQKLTPSSTIAPFTVQRTTASKVPLAVIEKAERHFVEHQRREQERISRLGQVRPEISADFQGYKFVAIGSRLMTMPSDRCKFFTMYLSPMPVTQEAAGSSPVAPAIFTGDWSNTPGRPSFQHCDHCG
jgi:hypothetical protein